MFKRTDDPFKMADNRIDVKWAYPEMLALWEGFSNEAMIPMMTAYLGAVDHTKTLEERLEFAANYNAMFPTLESALDAAADEVEYKREEFGGCPEEPDYRSNATIAWPKNRGDKPLPVIFYVVGGSTVCCMEGLAPAADLVKRFGCAVVVPHYRTCVEAPYPAAINDLHAAYAWMVDNADELGVDADKVVMMGASSGAQLGLCLAFRLKRFGYAPRAMMALDPITDERAIYPCSTLQFPGWDGEIMRYCYHEYLGQYYNSPFAGPEAMAGRATVEDCKGLCPIYLYTAESDIDRDASIHFALTLYAAGVFCDLHVYGGGTHGVPFYKPIVTDIDRETAPKLGASASDMINADIECLFQNDLRRPWLAE